jgi:hypothetical protein
VSTVTFLSNDALWSKLTEKVAAARHVDAAIAYFGQGGAKLLPLRKGDRLVVDMSPKTVKAGSTDPREVEKLMQRQVQVFTRRNLHAKLVIADNAVISGSANVSKHSQRDLDEAAILTTEPAAVRRAREFIGRLCTEPVRPEYLKRCKDIYRPPRFNGQQTRGRKNQQRVEHAKLWIVNLWEATVPDSEISRYEQGEKRAARKLRDLERSKADSFHWPRKPRMAEELAFGDWIIQAVTYKGKGVLVYPPAQLLLIDHYVRNRKSGAERWVFHFELPKRAETMSWKAFMRAVGPTCRRYLPSSPRTRAIRQMELADELLGLWTPGGRLAKR